MEDKILRMYRAPKGYVYVHRYNSTFAEAVADTKRYPANIDNFKLHKLSTQEQREIIETRRRKYGITKFS